MSSAPRIRPRLIFNDQLLHALEGPLAPCGIFGFVEERGNPAPFLAVRLSAPLAPRPDTEALKFGHTLLGEAGAEVMQFGVTFFEGSTYHVLVNPRSLLIEALMSRILATGSYFVFVIGPALQTFVFRADLDDRELGRFAEHHRRCARAKTSAEQYQAAVRRFAGNLRPSEELLEWVPGNAGSLTFGQHRLEMHVLH